jgi:hypothetical protein
MLNLPVNPLHSKMMQNPKIAREAIKNMVRLKNYL